MLICRHVLYSSLCVTRLLTYYIILIYIFIYMKIKYINLSNQYNFMIVSSV